MLYVKEFATRQELEDFLQGKIIGTPLDASKVFDVRGKTLTFTTPAATITFPSTTVFAEATVFTIAQEIENQSAGRASMRMYGHGITGRTAQLVLVHDGDVFTGGTAAAMLGLAAGTVGLNKIALASVSQLIQAKGGGSFTLVYDA
jgi:hypothetical protein